MSKLAINLESAYNAPITAGEPGSIIANLISVAFVASGVIILFMFVFAGIGMIKSAGANKPEDMAKAKKALTSALIGFVVVFTSYWIIQLIETITGSTFITNPGI